MAERVVGKVVLYKKESIQWNGIFVRSLASAE